MADSPIPPPMPGSAPSKMSGMAIASLVLGILGLCSGGLLAVLGLIFGIIAIVNINKSRGELAGHGIALAGIIISTLFMLLLPMAMLLPAIGAAKHRAQLISSVNNEKQLALAMRVYSSDHTNQLPPAATWCDAVNSIVRPAVFVRPGSDPGSRCGYAFNAALGDMDVNKVDPRTVMIFESDAGWNGNGGADIMLTTGYGRRAHFAAVAYVDGSVQIIPQSQLSTLRWNP